MSNYIKYILAEDSEGEKKVFFAPWMTQLEVNDIVTDESGDTYVVDAMLDVRKGEDREEFLLALAHEIVDSVVPVYSVARFRKVEWEDA